MFMLFNFVVRFISHEIRTPLNTVCMGLELLESELLPYQCTTYQRKDTSIVGDAPEKELEAVYWYEITRDIQENAANAVGILNELLKYDKIETGTLELEFEKVLVWDLAAKVVNQFKLQAVNRDIEMTFAFKADMVEQDVETGESLCPDALRHLVVYGDDMR
jgi:signal transduction histidine kinase